MSRHRGLFLGLAAMIGVMAGQARAETLTITVYAGSGTGGAVIYSNTGGSQAVTAVITALNSALFTAGYGAYTFSDLGGTSNNPGTAAVGGYVLTAGDLKVNTGVTGGVGGNGGIGAPITIALSEDGFLFPAGGPGSALVTSATANYAGTVAAPGSTQSDYSVFTDSTPMTVTGSTLTQPSNGTATDSHSNSLQQGLAAFVTPYTLTNVLTVALTPAAAAGSDGLSGKTSVISAVPEPASLVMMLTGLPVPLVVLGLLRRRRAA